MKIRHVLLACSFVFMAGCNTKSKLDAWDSYFDEAEYALVETKKDSLGVIVMQYYTHRTDTNRHYLKHFWEDGKIQASIFYYKKEKDGPFRMYDEKGNIEFQGMYLRNLHTGLDIYYKDGRVTDYGVFHNNKELPLDSTVKEMILGRSLKK